MDDFKLYLTVIEDGKSINISVMKMKQTKTQTQNYIVTMSY